MNRISICFAVVVGIGLLSLGAERAYSKSDIPTGLKPSPLFGAVPFSAKMLRMEEFGTQPLTPTSGSSNYLLPTPADCQSSPLGTELDAFLVQPLLYPNSAREAFELAANPWDTRIKSCLPQVTSTRMDGRPPGVYFSHQRWEDLRPTEFFQSAQAGARVNGGLRDRFQRHRYQLGEFGPGGLYYGAGTSRGVEPRFHPQMPIQSPNTVWTFDGTFPPKLLMARYGESVLFRHHNALPIDISSNHGFGRHTITTHQHNGHSPAESDGYAHAFFFPGQFFDYRWPMILSGHDTTNTGATEPKAGTPDGRGGIRRIPGDYRETMSTHWFHDHMLDFTAQNVYKGNAAMKNLYSAIDRGREPRTQAEARGRGAAGYGCNYFNSSFANLCLPSGTALDWGNRDYDINLMIADKAWDRNGQLAFNIFNTDGFLGDQITVNSQWKPHLEVRARRYRFRLLNASVSRYFKIALVNQQGARVPFHLIANDGNIMEHAVAFPNNQAAELPSMGVAERYDIIIDFSRFREGDRLYFVNLFEHQDGKGPKDVISLSEVLSGKYDDDPGVGKFLEFRVRRLPTGQVDRSLNPVDYVAGRKKMLPQPSFTQAELRDAKRRTFEFGRSSGTDDKPWTIKTDGGEGLTMDSRRVSAAPDKGTVEIWHIKSDGGGWSHPVHVHFEEGKILRRGGKAPPAWERWARKDVFRVGDSEDSTDSVEVAYRFRDFAGTYMEHCHNTQHEDRAMLLRWDIEHPGQTISLPTPIPDWSGVSYVDSFKLPTADTGDVNPLLLLDDYEML